MRECHLSCVTVWSSCQAEVCQSTEAAGQSGHTGSQLSDTEREQSAQTENLLQQPAVHC